MALQQQFSVQVAPWIKWWLGLSAVLVVYDAGYALLRPWTFAGGALSWLYQPYNNLYQHVDLVYSHQRWLTGDRFCEAQSVCNIVEVALQLLSLRLLAGGRKTAQAGALLALTTQALTFWKTTLYWLMDILSGFGSTGHNDPLTLLLVYIIPNGLWLVFPLLVVVELAGQVLAVLNTSASKDSSTKAA